MGTIKLIHTTRVDNLNSTANQEISFDISETTTLGTVFGNLQFFLIQVGINPAIVNKIFSTLSFDFKHYNGSNEEELEEVDVDSESVEAFKEQLLDNPDFLEDVFHVYLDSLEDE